MNALLVMALLSAAPAPKPTVAVLYFDNNTNQRDYDVLQKGLADMVITDLATSEQLQVVEREKLDALLAEQKLQSSKYFDAATAVKIGKLAGASHAVTGAFTAFAPEIRLDVRMIDVATSKVVASASVHGKPEAFFDLERELVQSFLGALAAKLPSDAAKSTVTLATALSYSKSLDQADRGDLEGASAQLAALVREAPDFRLAKSRYLEMLRRLREAKQRRESALSEDERLLTEAIDASMAKNAAKAIADSSELHAHLCYRAYRSALLAWKLKKLLGPPQGPFSYSVPSKESLPAARKLIDEIWSNELGFIADAGMNLKQLDTTNFTLVCANVFFFEKETKDFSRLKTLGIRCDDHVETHPADRAWKLGLFVALGQLLRPSADGERTEVLRVAPTLLATDREKVKKALDVLAQAEQFHDAHPAPASSIHGTLAKICAVRAALLANTGRREEAIAALQSFLDANPKSTEFKTFEAEMERLLGVSEKAKAEQQELAACTASDEALRSAIDTLFDTEGTGGVAKALAKLGPECPIARKAFANAAWGAAVRGDCPAAKTFARQADDATAIDVVCP